MYQVSNSHPPDFVQEAGMFKETMNRGIGTMESASALASAHLAVAARMPLSVTFGKTPGNYIGPCAAIPEARLPQRTAPCQHSLVAR